MENSNLRLVYCFSKKLSTSEYRFKISVDSLKKSIEVNSKFHDIKLYTDKDTFKFVENFTKNIEIVDYDDFLFLDDIKIQTLPLLSSNEILIDIDIFLSNKVFIYNNCDIILERPVSKNSYWYRECIEKAKNLKFFKFLNLNIKDNVIGNIGIIKINNEELLLKYLDYYKKCRNLAIEEREHIISDFSMLIGQLGLKNVIDSGNFSVKYLSSIKGNNYIHLAGNKKYENSEYIKNSTERLNKTII
jgi:hypothetical protein